LRAGGAAAALRPGQGAAAAGHGLFLADVRRAGADAGQLRILQRLQGGRRQLLFLELEAVLVRLVAEGQLGRPRTSVRAALARVALGQGVGQVALAAVLLEERDQPFAVALARLVALLQR